MSLKLARSVINCSYLLAGLVLIGAGCTTVPAQLASAPEHSPTIAAVQTSAGKYMGQRVRWGGTIVSVENKSDHTTIQIISRTLSRRARPRQGDRSDGRFIAHIEGFVDPGIYTPDRELTVVGTLKSTVVNPIGDAGYLFPVVQANGHYLWKKRPDRSTPYYSSYPYGYPYYRRFPHSVFDPYFLFTHDPYNHY